MSLKVLAPQPVELVTESMCIICLRQTGGNKIDNNESQSVGQSDRWADGHESVVPQRPTRD